MANFIDFYIIDQNDPTYTVDRLIEDEVLNVILQKYKMVLFTNKGDLFGDPEFGADLLKLLYETKVSASFVEREITTQITNYISELNSTNYTLEVQFVEDTYNYQDMMFIYFKVADYEVYSMIGNKYSV
jgi:hypothetical protein